MRVAIFGSNDWNDYNSFIRNMTVFLQDAKSLGWNRIDFIHAGKNQAENMITEYVNKTEKLLRQNNFKIKEEFFKKRDKFSDVGIIESGIDYALVFSTKDKRSYACKNLLEAYNIPYAIFERA